MRAQSAITAEDFQLLSELVRERSGLVVPWDKLYLVESRLLPVAEAHGMAGLDELCAAIRRRREEALLAAVTEAMATKESLFFRDGKPYEHVRTKVLPALRERRSKQRALRLWSAACAAGQEPYSLAMCVREEAARFADWRVDIVATDFSSEVLEKARSGLYSSFEVQRGLPGDMLAKYFRRVGEMWRIDDSIRAMVSFRRHNLLDDFTVLGRFDVIFCRNVLIYFDQTTRRSVLERLGHVLAGDGFLVLGAVESAIGATAGFRPVPGCPGIYTPGRAAQ